MERQIIIILNNKNTSTHAFIEKEEFSMPRFVPGARPPAAHSGPFIRKLFPGAALALALGSPYGAALGQEDASSDGVAALPAITVSGALPSGVTEGTDSYTTDATSTATRLTLSPRETPQSFSVVTRQRMDDQGLLSIRDVLDATPGISSRQLDSDRVSFSARGFAIDNFMYDGVPTNIESAYASGDATLDTVIYDRVEVIRGANGLTMGAGEPSAAINLVRKKPLREFAASAGVTVGSWDFYRAEADISTPVSRDGSVRARIAAAYQSEGSYIDLYKQRHSVFYGAIDFDLGPDTLLSLGYDYQKTSPTGTTWGGFPLFYSDGSRTDFRRSVTTAADWTNWNTEAQTLFATLEHRFANDWKARVSFSHSRNDYDAKLLWLTGYPDRDTGLGMTGGATARYIGNRQQNTVDVYATGPFQLLGRRHELVLGYTGNHQRAVNDNYAPLSATQPIGDFYEWDGSYPEPEWSDTGSGGDRAKTRQTGAYVAARFSLADPLKLILGARLSNWKTDQYSWGDEFSYEHDNVFTPYAGLIYDIDDTYSVYASYTEIFKPQSYRDASGRYLDPVEGKNYEIGLKGEYLQGRLNASAALFEVKQDNLAQIDVGKLLPDGSQAYYAAQGTRTRGFEIELAGELTPGWNMFAGYTHYTAKDADGKAVNTTAPRSLFKLFTTYRLPGGWSRLTVGGGVSWQSRTFSAAIGPQGETEVGQGSYALVDLMARYRFNDHLTATLNLNNLTDKKYYTQMGFYDQGFYGAPRHAMLNLRYQY